VPWPVARRRDDRDGARLSGPRHRIDDPGLEPVLSGHSFWVHKRKKWVPRVFAENVVFQERSSADYSFVYDSPNASDIRLSHLHYPGWKAYLDERPIDLVLDAEGFYHLSAPVGKHTIRMVFRSTSFLLGSIISLVTFFVLLIVCWKKRDETVGASLFGSFPQKRES